MQEAAAAKFDKFFNMISLEIHKSFASANRLEIARWETFSRGGWCWVRVNVVELVR